jgi:hypothetical protein
MPQPIDDADIADLSMELNNVQLDDNLHGVEDIVPEADPDIETNVSVSKFRIHTFDHNTIYSIASQAQVQVKGPWDKVLT